MPYRDLREFLARLDSEGELGVVKAEVDWNLELGAITRRALDLRACTPLFENIKGYPPGFRVLAHPLGPSKPHVHGRVALAMDLPKDTPTEDLIETFAARSQGSIKPIAVSTGSCKENIRVGGEVNLLDFPAPLQHATDGGRYFGTMPVCVTRDPDTGWVNWGTYRMMLHSKNTLGWMASPHQHGPGIYYQKFEARGKAMPMAVAIGTEPISYITAACWFPASLDEADIAGAIRGEPVELVKCETIDLMVPASAEIVLEGEVRPYEREKEGPFGEFTGYSSGEGGLQPVFHVSCITHRNDPILAISVPGRPWDGDAPMFAITTSALLRNELRSKRISFRSIYLPPPNECVVVSAAPLYPGYAQTIAEAIWSTKVGAYRPFIFVVGEDIDVTNTDEILWCLTTRLHPGRGIRVQHNAPAIPLYPFISREERMKRTTSRAFFDATFPFEWPPEDVPTIVDLEHAWPPEVRTKVLERWEELF